MPHPERIARFKCQPSFGCFPIPVTKIEMLTDDGRYWIEVLTVTGDQQTKAQHKLASEEAEAWVSELAQIRLPVRMQRPCVGDGEMGAIEIFSSGSKLTVEWHSMLPEEAVALSGFVEWLKQFANQHDQQQ